MNESPNKTKNSIPLKIKPKKRVQTKKINPNIATQDSKSRSSIYRGVTRHRWTGRYEAHLWDKTCNTIQNKRGRQVYLGAYDNEEDAARTYDLAALKYWGPTTILNFPVQNYTKEVEEMEKLTKEEYIVTLRRRSSGFSRGVSKYRGVARHHNNGKWEARIGRVPGNKYLYLGTYGTQEEAAVAYDIAAIKYRGLSAVTNFDISNYSDKLNTIMSQGVEKEHEHTPKSNICDETTQQTNETSNSSQAMINVEANEDPEQTNTWDFCLDDHNSFDSFPIPDISLDETSEFLRLFDEKGTFEEDITFDEAFGDIEQFLMQDDDMSMSMSTDENGLKGTGMVASQSSSSLSTMTSDCSNI